MHTQSKAEDRNPKAEGRPKTEIRSRRFVAARTAGRMPFAFTLRPSRFALRSSAFLRPSVFGLRVSICSLLAVTTVALAQPRPYIGYVYPAGGQQGTNVQIRLGGQGLDDLTGVLVTGAGVTA